MIRSPITADTTGPVLADTPVRLSQSAVADTQRASALIALSLAPGWQAVIDRFAIGTDREP